MQFSKYMADTENTVSNGDGEIRTLDPLLARQVLSQLSYTPTGYGLRWALPLFREFWSFKP